MTATQSTDLATNFTPTTERVRDRFIAHSAITHSAIGGLAEYAAAFDRWFASVTQTAPTIQTVQTVKTTDEYAALPIGSVVRSTENGQVVERVDENEDEDRTGYRWVYTGELKGTYEHFTIARVIGEGTVLYRPAAVL